MEKGGYVYILTNKSNDVLYTGVTNDIARRLYEHQQGAVDSFSKRYKTEKLVYADFFNDIRDAIAAEKAIKAGSRKKKIELIEQDNPGWRDLSDDL